jgi:hypothetical protein
MYRSTISSLINKIMNKLFIAILCLFLSEVASAQVMLQKAVVSNGGGVATNGTTNAALIAGQTAAGSASNGQINGHFGFFTNANAVNSVNAASAGAITSLQLSPNPASDQTSISITLANSGSIDLLLYDAAGHLIATLFSGKKDAGTFIQRLDTKTLASGAYFIAARIPGAMMQTKLDVVK